MTVRDLITGSDLFLKREKFRPDKKCDVVTLIQYPVFSGNSVTVFTSFELKV